MTSDAPDPVLAAALARIAADFDAAMPGRIRDLRDVLARARTGGRDALAALVDGLHRLAGNAGTFGHGEVSARARELEVRLATAADGGGEAVADVLSDVGHFLDDLASAFPGPADG